MKKQITLALLLLLFTQTLKAQVIEKTVKWSCPHLPYEDVIALPENEYIAVILSYNINGDAKVNFKPNIFADNILKSAKKLFNSIAYKDKQPESFVDYSGCVKDFLNEYERELELHNKKCKNCVKNTKAVVTNLEDKIYSDKNTKKFKNKKKIPAYIPYHNLKLYSSKEFKRIYQSICNGRNLNSEDFNIATSMEMAKQVQRWAADLNSEFSENCIQKYVNLNSKIGDQIDCEKVDCDFFKKDTDDYQIMGEVISSIRGKSIKEKEKELIYNNRLFSKDDINEEVKEKLFNSFSGGYNCYFHNVRTIPKGYNRDVNMDMNDNPEILGMFLKEKDQELSRDCKLSILNNLLARFYIKDDPNTSEFCQKFGCPEMKKRSEQFEDLITSLVGNLYGNSNIEYYCENRNDLRGGTEVYKKVDSLLKSLDQINQCSQMKPGESKVVDVPGYKSLTGIEMQYLLEQKDANSMLATIAIDFGDDEQGQKMQKDVKSCLDLTSSYFKDSNGSAINVNIINPEEAKKMPSSKRPPTVKVGIGEIGMRSNSRKYAADANCATMTHEVLHLMGLCDEYEENSTGYYVDTETGEVYNKDIGPDMINEGRAKFILAYNACRSIPKDVSIMKHHWEALDETLKTQSTCECTSSLCEKIVSNSNDKYLDIMLNNPWSDMWRFKNACKQTYIKSEKIKDLKDLDKINTPIQLIKSSGDAISFYDHEFYTGGMGVSDAGSYAKRKYECQCQQKDCEESFHRLKERVEMGSYTSQGYCPSGTDNIERKNVKDNESITSNIKKINDKTFQMIKSPARTSLLQPAQFERIKWGNCEEKVKKYSECAKNAYKGLAKDCPDIPPYCKDEDQWLKSSN